MNFTQEDLTQTIALSDRAWLEAGAAYRDIRRIADHGVTSENDLTLVSAVFHMVLGEIELRAARAEMGQLP